MKIYKVKINEQVTHKLMWYNSRRNQIFDCFLKPHDKKDLHGNPIIVFAVDTTHVIYQQDCSVISERVKENG